MLSHGQTVHFRPHTMGPIVKAEHLRIKMSYLEPILVHPVRRQNFRDTVAQKCNPYLIRCLNRLILSLDFLKLSLIIYKDEKLANQCYILLRVRSVFIHP